jgi:hypothetical protein
MELLSKTSVKTKSQGDGLTSKDVNSINDTLNNLIDVVNAYLKKYCDVNIECGSSTKTFTFENAALAVPESRRNIGLKLRFRGIDNKFYEYVFSGTNIEGEEWTKEENWLPIMTIVDGGEW